MGIVNLNLVSNSVEVTSNGWNKCSITVSGMVAPAFATERVKRSPAVAASKLIG